MLISAKSIKQLCRGFGYELSSNAFGLLDKKVKERMEMGVRMEIVNEWLLAILKAAAEDELEEGERRIVKKGDIERIISQMSEDEEDVEIAEKNSVSDGNQSASLNDAQSESLNDMQSDMSDDTQSERFISDISQQPRSFVEIVQLPSKGQVDEIEELKDEVERLKKIIQIILNKQAELV